MRIAIVGAGGVGGYIAAKLATSGQDVAVVARGKHLAQIRSQGLRLAEPQGTIVARFDEATNRAADIGPVDLVIIAVKAQHLVPALAEATPLFGPATRVLPFQNGIDAPDMVARKVGTDRTLIGVARIFANITEPGLITRYGTTPSFTIGDAAGGQASVADIRMLLREAAIDVPDCPDVRIDLWRKFILFNAISGVTAGGRTNVDGIRTHSELQVLFTSLAEEALAVGRAEGIHLPQDALTSTLDALERMPAEARASTAHDLAGGRPLEIDWIMGAVVRLGAKTGIPTPASQAVHAMLAPFRNG